MATRKDYTDRSGEGKQMKQRLLRLTDEENEMLDDLIAETGMTMRDLIAILIENEHIKLIKKNKEEI